MPFARACSEPRVRNPVRRLGSIFAPRARRQHNSERGGSEDAGGGKRVMACLSWAGETRRRGDDVRGSSIKESISPGHSVANIRAGCLYRSQNAYSVAST